MVLLLRPNEEMIDEMTDCTQAPAAHSRLVRLGEGTAIAVLQPGPHGSLVRSR